MEKPANHNFEGKRCEALKYAHAPVADNRDHFGPTTSHFNRKISIYRRSSLVVV